MGQNEELRAWQCCVVGGGCCLGNGEIRWVSRNHACRFIFGTAIH